MPGRFRTPAGVAIAIAAVLTIGAQSAAADPLVSVAARADAPLSELGRPTVVTVPGGGLVQHYDQRVGGLPVLGAETVVAAPSGERPMVVADSTATGITRHDAGEAISRERAIDAAETATGAERLRGPAKAKLGIDPATDTLAWQVSLPSAAPLADFVVTIDGRTGEKLRSRDVLRHATGTAAIYDPNPVVEQGGYSGLRDRKDKDSPLLTSLRLTLQLPRITSGKGCLSGTYVDARIGEKGHKVCDKALDFTNITRSNSRFEALMAYFHIDRTRAYADALGLSKPLRRKPQKVLADAITDDNSFYSSQTHELVLGTGGVDDGEDADVIVHEYGHSLQDQASPGSLQKREGATMGEGFGDYVAAMMSALTTGGSPFDTCIFDWDGIAYSPTGTCGRLANRTYNVEKAERRCQKEIHCVGEVWSSTLFGLRIALGNDPQGRSVMDRVALESNFMLTRKSNFADGARALIAADNLLYAGAHAAAIESAMVEKRFCKASGC